MKNGEGMHVNRTGAAMKPQLTASLLEGARHTRPSTRQDPEAIARMRVEYADEAEPVGSIPPPATLKGVLKTAAKALTGKQALVLADKLGERLAFERSGTRLYDALISKFDAYGSWRGGPSRQDLMEIRADEHAHFTLVKQAIEQMGADPTAVTPSANLHAVASKGLCAVLTDPRTTLRDGLEAILVAELVDNDCWENLVDLSRALGNQDMAEAFTEALTQEREHLRKVRLWLGSSLSTQATGGVAEPFLERVAERDRRQLVATAATEDERADGSRKVAVAKRRTTRSAPKRPARASRTGGTSKRRKSARKAGR